MSRGFTLVELLVTLGIFLVIIAVTIPLYSRLELRPGVSEGTADLRADLWYVQAQAKSGVGNAAAGIAIGTSTYTLFRGSSFGARNPAYDHIKTIPSGVSQSGVSEIVFARWTGLPTATGTITLTELQTGKSKLIQITAYGRIE